MASLAKTLCWEPAVRNKQQTKQRVASLQIAQLSRLMPRLSLVVRRK